VPSPEQPLATVTELARRPSPAAEPAAPELTTHARFLQARYGDRWRDLPTALGQPLVHAEALLSSGPVTIPPTMPAMKAIVRARRAARAAAAMGKIARNEAEVLEHALGARLVDLPLPRLSAVAEAVLGLQNAPPAEPSWASPQAAHAADALLDACNEDLREASRTHAAVYTQFTDRIWDIPLRRLQKGRRPWRLIARARLRHALAASSRTEKAPKPMSVAVDLVLEALAVRDRLAAAAPLLANHLGDHDRGPHTEVDSARESLNAVRNLQRALGDRLNVERLARLLAAGAFTSDAVLAPAARLVVELQGWSTKVSRLGGSGAVAMDLSELVRWSSLVDEALPAVEAAVTAVDRPGHTATLRDLVYDLLVRERYERLITAPLPAPHITPGAGTAS
jgi:hypothetical protein